MLVQKYIREKGWDALKDLFIEVREYDCGLRVLNYSQFDGVKTCPVSMECRGLILDQDANIVCRPFSRFFNYGEANTKDFDFSDVTVYEKADGSMVKVYWCPQTNHWEIGTRGTAFAEANHVYGTRLDMTFREAILGAMGFTEERFQDFAWSLDMGFTYIFEYVSPFNRIVTSYSEPMVVLLAAVSLSGFELDVDRLFDLNRKLKQLRMNVRMPAIYTAISAMEIVAMAESLENLQEGFVVYDNKTGNRLKVKSSLYCNVHHLRGNGSPSCGRLMEVVLKNEQDELLAYFPEFKEMFVPIEDALDVLKTTAKLMYEAHCSLESQKDFALKVKDAAVAPILFKARKDKTDTWIAFESMELSQQMKLLEKFI